MSSLFVKAKKLSVLTKYTFKCETLGFFSSFAPQKTITSKSVLCLHSVYKNHTFLNIRNCWLSSSSTNDIGKVVELDVEFDEIKIDDNVIKQGNKSEKHKSRNLKVDVNAKIKKEINEDLLQKNDYPTQKGILKSNENLNCNILRSTMTKLKFKKNREKNKEILLEGKRLIHDALLAGLKPVKIFLSRRSDSEKLNLPKEVKIYKVPYKNLQLWSDVVTSPGIIGVFKMPDPTTSNRSPDSLPLTVICDNIRDPGNLGSILRVVAAVNCSKLILTPGCIDIWESKVLRGSAGAHFRLPIISHLHWSDIENEISTKSKVVLADLNYSFTQNENESSNGISNFKTQNEASKILPVQCYYSIKYSNSENVVLVIGGETHGLSDDAYKFAVNRKGTRGFIPLSNGIESLNNSVALGIFAYEFKRQFDSEFVKESLLPSQVPESKS